MTAILPLWHRLLCRLGYHRYRRCVFRRAPLRCERCEKAMKVDY